MDIWHRKQYVHCAPNKSKLTLGSCHTNQEQALIGARALIAGGSVSSVPEHQIERFMACSGCAHCRVVLPVNRVRALLREEFNQVADSLENFDWYQHDNDVRAERSARRSRQGWQRQLRSRVGL